MKDAYAGTLIEGQAVDTIFALRSREMRSARTGDAYLSVELGDRTGFVRGVRFRPTSDEQAVPVGTVVRVRGRVTRFRGVRRILVDEFRAVAEYDSSDLLPAGRRDMGEMLEHLERLRSGIRDHRLADVVGQVLDEPGFASRLVVCPGGRDGHHACAGGLLEHTLSVSEAALRLAGWFDRVNADLLLTAALVHDVGRVDEIECDTTINCSDAGRMLGHVVLSERRVARAVERLGDTVPSDLGLALSHIVLSHHGDSSGLGSLRPCMLEAVVLRHADLLDVEFAGYVEAVSGAGTVNEEWTSGHNAFGRPLLVPRGAVPGPSSGQNWNRCPA